MITADNITDEQIRELRDWASGKREITIMHFAHAALGLDPTANRVGPAAIASARARCAEILNARNGQ